MMSAFIPQSETIRNVNISLTTYENLFQHYGDSVQCSCSQVSIRYESCLTITPRLHPICSSDFVSERWINHLYGEGKLLVRFLPQNFQYSASAQFIFLSSICKLANETVNDGLLQLGTNNFINHQLLPASLMDDKIRRAVGQFQAIIPNLLLSTLSLIREITGANRMMSALGTSWIIYTPSIILHGVRAYPMPVIYDGCNCALSSKCVQSSQGMFSGCYPVEALFRSTLRCFYDQQCIDPNNTFAALNVTPLESSRFKMNATIESVVNELMVEEYSTNISYENYFHACSPSSCVYAKIKYINTIDGITSLIALYAGLMIICRAISVLMFKVLWHHTTTVNSNAT
jgi:hypothetical protein